MDRVSRFLEEACEMNIIDKFRNRRVSQKKFHRYSAELGKFVPENLPKYPNAKAACKSLASETQEVPDSRVMIAGMCVHLEDVTLDQAADIDRAIAQTGRLQKELAQHLSTDPLYTENWGPAAGENFARKPADIEKQLKIETIVFDGRAQTHGVEYWFDSGELFADHVIIVDNKVDITGKYLNVPIQYELAG